MRRVRMAAALVTACMIVGCSGGGVEAPAGFTAATNGPAGFAYPDGWETSQVEGSNTVALGATGPGELRQNAILKIDPSFSGDFDTAVDSLGAVADVQFQDRQTELDEQFDVPGAEQARLLGSTYRQPGEVDETLVDIQQFDLFALGPDGNLYYLQVGSPVELFDEAQFRQIVDSFTLEA